MKWSEFIKIESEKDYFKSIVEAVNRDAENYKILPERIDIFSAFKSFTVEQTKVVILGQDPYINDNEAMGMSFSIPASQIKIPPSLRNIFKELNQDLGIQIPDNGDLTPWSRQGVLLLNSVLTVRAGQSGSHSKFGWQTFTDAVISTLNQQSNPIVFILWGKFAKSKIPLITEPQHLILTSPHPSPFSANTGFFGSKPFSKTNDFLISKNLQPIDWQIPNIRQRS